MASERGTQRCRTKADGLQAGQMEPVKNAKGGVPANSMKSAASDGAWCCCAKVGSLQVGREERVK